MQILICTYRYLYQRAIIWISDGGLNGESPNSEGPKHSSMYRLV